MDRSQQNPQVLLDPEPFTLVVDIIGALSGATTLAEMVSRRLGSRQRGKDGHGAIRNALDKTEDALRRLEVDYDIAKEILLRGHSRELRDVLDFGHGVLLEPAEFKRFKEAATNILGQLKVIRESILAVEGHSAVPDDAGTPFLEASHRVDEVRGGLRRLLRDESVPVREGLNGLDDLIRLTRAEIHEARTRFLQS